MIVYEANIHIFRSEARLWACLPFTCSQSCPLTHLQPKVPNTCIVNNSSSASWQLYKIKFLDQHLLHQKDTCVYLLQFESFMYHRIWHFPWYYDNLIINFISLIHSIAFFLVIWKNYKKMLQFCLIKTLVQNNIISHIISAIHLYDE